MNDRSLEFRKHTQYLKQRFAGGRACIDPLAIEVQVNSSAVQLAAPFRAAYPLVAELGCYLPSPPLASFTQRLALVIDGLSSSTYP